MGDRPKPITADRHVTAGVDSPDVGWEVGRWLDPVEDATWRSWMAMTERVRAQLARDLLQECGMSEADYGVLVHVSERPDHRIRMSDLAGALGWSKSRLSHQVARMEARGQLRKEGCPSDARGWFAVLSESGLNDIERAAPRHVASVRRTLLDALDRPQIEELQVIAKAVVDHLASSQAPINSGCPLSEPSECGSEPSGCGSEPSG